jgi:hypothetical protein
MEKEHAIIWKIAEVSSAIGWQAGVDATGLAGLIVSFLAANPEEIERFMADGSELFIDGTIAAEKGCLNYTAINGELISPERLRTLKGILSN